MNHEQEQTQPEENPLDRHFSLASLGKGIPSSAHVATSGGLSKSGVAQRQSG